MKDLILETLRESVKHYPELLDHLNAKAARIIFEDDLRGWETNAIEQINSKKSAICDFPSRAVPDGVIDMIKFMLGYADCEGCIRRGFDDIREFVKADKPKEYYQKFTPKISGIYVYTPGDIEITEKDINRALRTWDKLMPEYAGMLDAKVESE